jgi:uncharacterized protein (TIGR00251 family)
VTATLHAVIRVRVQPGAKKPGVVSYKGGVLRLKVSAPPLDGRANDAVVEAVAGLLGVRRSQVSLIRGERSREKTLRVDGLSQLGAEARLAAAAKAAT